MPVIPTESSEQIRFVNRVRQFYPGVLIFAIPNGGNRNAMEATKLKEEGVLAGVPDLCIPEPRGPYAGLWVEMKRQSGGSVSKEQKEIHEKLAARGYSVVVAAGCDVAWKYFEAYMSMYNSLAVR